MEKSWFNLILSKGELEYRCRLIKSIDSRLGPIENTTVNEDLTRNDTDKNINDCSDISSYYSKVDHLVDIKDIQNFISNDTFLIRDSNQDRYSIYFNKSFFYSYHNSSYMNNGSRNDEPYYHFNFSILSGNDNSNDNYIYNYICGEGENSSEGKNFDIITRESGNDLILKESSNYLDLYKDLWVQCECKNCYEVNYKKSLNSKMNICEQCGYNMKIRSSDRIKLSIDPGTWVPMDEDMISLDPIEFQKTGLTEAIQTGTVGEKITRLIEYATNNFLPLILVCASAGAHMQEGSLSLMQMAKICSALYDYQSNKKLFYVSILTSPTTGGVTMSIGMLGDIIIAERNAYIAFASKRVIEQTLNKTIPDGSQAAEYLFHKGLFDPFVPRNPLKSVLSEKEGIVCIFRWVFPGKNRRIFLQFLMKDIQSIRIEVKEGIYTHHVLYMKIRGQRDVPLTRTDENLTPHKIEQKAAELAYFLRRPIEVF
ncbi:hypothetical protein ES288_D04G159000v1 [Gossypium darwinii]|uniref:Photosystem I assembly protein Ycf4 n=1 Tax=Gossypium darwinii TaxID=34276 RepID=A0A5D2CZC5_GOSDA|nr:hypothetical protein ES288_D04G159000v1 [Gossypium darwinii]